MLFVIIAGAMITACQKSDLTQPEDQQQQQDSLQNNRSVTDTLMVYSMQQPNGKTNIVSKSFKTGEVKPIVLDATDPFASNERLVFVKGGTTIGFAKLDGISKMIAQLTQPSDPTLSVDSKSICVIDKTPEGYQLLLLDTLGNKNVLYQTTDRIASPAFSSDGQKIAFADYVTPKTSNVIILTLSTKGVHRVTAPGSDYYDNYCTVMNGTIYFTRSHYVDSVLSSEIYSCDFNGANIQQLTNYTSNWTTASFSIQDLRKISSGIDSSSIICSTNKTGNSDIYLYKIGGDLTPLTQTSDTEAYPSFIPDYIKE